MSVDVRVGERRMAGETLRDVTGTCEIVQVLRAEADSTEDEEEGKTEKKKGRNGGREKSDETKAAWREVVYKKRKAREGETLSSHAQLRDGPRNSADKIGGSRSARPIYP